MSIKPIDERLSQMTGVDVSGMAADSQPTVEQLPQPISYDQGGSPTGESGEPVQVAGLGTQFLKETLAPLLKRGAKVEKDVKVVPDPVAPVQQVAPPAPPATPGPKDLPPAPQAPAPVGADVMVKQAAERERLITEGKTAGAPSPTEAQRAAGVTETPISTMAFDNDGMQATIRSAAERLIKEEPEVSVRSMYMRAINAGVPEEQANRILSGVEMESKVGGSQLSTNVSGLIRLHDESASQLDDLFSKMAANQLDDAGKLKLRQQMAFHDMVVKSLKGVQVDVARTMNAFKRVQDAGPGLQGVDIRKILDDVGGDDALFKLATDYVQVPGRAGRNKLLEVGIGKRLREAWFYTYQANLLTNPESHAYNLVANSLYLLSAPVERLGAVGVGKFRQGLKLGSSDRYYMEDVLAQVSGVPNGLMDGWELAVHTAKTGQRASAKGEVRASPISAQALSNVPVRVGNVAATGLDVASMGVTGLTTGVPLPISPMLGGLSDFGKEVWRTPDLTNSWIGKGIDYLGHLVGMPFRGLSAADEFTGGVAARMQLHSEAWRLANTEYDKLIASGLSHDDAMKEVTRQVGSLLRERPETIAANVEKFKKQSQFADDIDKSTMLGRGYWKLEQLFQIPMLKVHVPFAKTINQIWIEGAARVPGLNIASPRFWDEWNKGGRNRDLAISRVALGGIATSTFGYLSMSNRITGSGPSDPADLKALEKQGYQKRSFVFKSDEISEDNLNKLQTSNLARVSQGTGSLKGLYFISYDRLQPVSIPMTIGADYGDYLKFYSPKPGMDGLLSPLYQYAFATAAASSQYIKDLPSAQGIGEIVSILRTRQEDDGQKVLDVFTKLGRQYTDFLFHGVPVVGLAGSPGSAAIERTIDPTIRSGRAEEENVPSSIKFLYDQKQRLWSRTPGLSKDVRPELDNLGRIQTPNVSPAEMWVNWTPTLRISAGKESKADAALASIDHGISQPRSTWDGVNLTSEQFNRYKELYGQVIQLPGSDGEMRNLEKAIPFELKAAQEEALSSGEPFLKGDAQKYIDRLVSTYRRMAKLRMIGFDPSPESNQPEAAAGEELGLIGDKVEFPELSANIRANKEFVRRQGK